MTLDVISAVRRRTRRLAVIALLTCAGVAVVVALLVFPAGPRPDATVGVGASPASTAPSSAPASAAPAPGGMLPADLSWVRLAGVDLPMSATAGPSQTVGNLARGFAHTRSGAVLAALHLLVRTTPQVGPQVFEPTLAEQVVGQHAPAMRAAVAEDYRRLAGRAGVVYGQPLADLPAAVAGVRIEADTATRVSVSVLTSTTDAAGVTRYAATTVSVVWSERDWRLLAPPDGRWDDLVRLVDPAQSTSYTPLSGR